MELEFLRGLGRFVTVTYAPNTLVHCFLSFIKLRYAICILSEKNRTDLFAANDPAA